MGARTMADKMRVYVDLKELVEREIQNIVRKDEMDDKCLEHLDKLVDIAKDIDTIFAMNDYSEGYEDYGYSQNARYPHIYRDDTMPMVNGNSYQRRDNMGRYSRGYSRSDGMIRDRLESMMNEATTEHEREEIRSAIDRLN